MEKHVDHHEDATSYSCIGEQLYYQSGDMDHSKCLAYQSNPSAPLWIFFERINMNLKKQTIMEKHVDHHEDATSYSMHWRAALLPKWRYGSFNVV
ncbi:uncharacterized protein LOC120353709 isoform X2 [Nilaparvata lugens]|uniref:uncharacterized protein LOC120353709 isoform X2 n=1 Tax=Nilaparvata lugens TaxID=108931 RepID=UPI00193D73C0|nr:uncharacterized protein LOC120353709 isoform X2 [Nilaparvata lugens]